MFYTYNKLIDITTSVFSEKQLVAPILGTSGYRKMTAFFMPRIGLANDRRSRAKAPHGEDKITTQ